MISQFNNFSPNLTYLTVLLRKLFRQHNSWTRNQLQDQVVANIKEELIKPTMLTLFDVNTEVVLLIPCPELQFHHYNLQEKAGLLLALSVGYLPASSQSINGIKKAQAPDPVVYNIYYCMVVKL